MVENSYSFVFQTICMPQWMEGFHIERKVVGKYRKDGISILIFVDEGNAEGKVIALYIMKRFPQFSCKPLMTIM